MVKKGFHSWTNGNRWLNLDGAITREDVCKKCGCLRTMYLKEDARDPQYLWEWVGGYELNMVPTHARPSCIIEPEKIKKQPRKRGRPKKQKDTTPLIDLLTR